MVETEILQFYQKLLDAKRVVYANGNEDRLVLQVSYSGEMNLWTVDVVSLRKRYSCTEVDGLSSFNDTLLERAVKKAVDKALLKVDGRWEINLSCVTYSKINDKLKTIFL